jgi:hypothetical protein
MFYNERKNNTLNVCKDCKVKKSHFSKSRNVGTRMLLSFQNEKIIMLSIKD